jgi:polyadenylate-binding protein
MFKDFYFAFVQFQKVDDAKKACTEFRFPTLCGVKCRILPFNNSKNQNQAPHSYNAKPAPKNTQLFVKGLPVQWTHEDLAKAFEKFGKILSCKVSIDSEYNSRQYGFVQLDSEKATQNAIAAMNDFEFEQTDENDAAKLSVCEFVPRLDRIGTTKPPCNTNLYVKNLPSEDCTDEELRAIFEPFGEVQSAAVMRDEEAKSKNFGFVNFKSSEDAQKAVDHFKSAAQENKQDGDKKLFVCEFKSKRQRQLELEKSAYQFKKSMNLLNLIVKNVDSDATKEEFEAFFKNFGEVRSCKVIPEASLGFVCFTEREAARMAKEQPELIFKNRKLCVEYCEPREMRQKKQEENWDRQNFHRSKANQSSSSNQDVIQLITSLSLLMSQMQNGGKGAPQQQRMTQY